VCVGNSQDLKSKILYSHFSLVLELFYFQSDSEVVCVIGSGIF